MLVGTGSYISSMYPTSFQVSDFCPKFRVDETACLLAKVQVETFCNDTGTYFPKIYVHRVGRYRTVPKYGTCKPVPTMVFIS